MNGEKFNRVEVKQRVLVAPLDWGLGHATRCIPIIKHLIINGIEVIIAAEAGTLALLSAEFPALEYLSLKGYNIEYSRNPKRLGLSIFLQIPKIILRIMGEHKWLKEMVKQHKIDAVISDNRPGLHHQKISTVYITHQLNIKTGNRFTGKIAQRLHYYFVNKFNECWVPDAGDGVTLAGMLSHPTVLPNIPLKYLGPVSRFDKIDIPEKQYDLLFLLSGPEPQRSLFEEKIEQQLKDFIGSALIVRGLPSDTTSLRLDNPSIGQVNHLPATLLNEAIQQSKLIISRSGYTTVMDLAKLQQRAVLVPTPGQQEQEYLANYLMEKKVFYCVKQDEFLLSEILERIKQFPFTALYIPETYQKFINEWCEGL